MEPFDLGVDGTDLERRTSGVLEPQDTLDDLGGDCDVLDTGWSPPERPWGSSTRGRRSAWKPSEKAWRGGCSRDGLGHRR